MDPRYFDPIATTAEEIRSFLLKGTLNSVQIVSQYLHQIETHNANGANLNAMISVVPKAKLLAIAATLDIERAEGKERSALHGIPIVLKDNIMTDSELIVPTTVCSYAFATAKVKKAAWVADTLTKRGLIILGKTNLTEFCGLKTKGMTPGYSTYGGQTQSPYVQGGLIDGELMLDHSSPGGSSTGSAVAVAAGFAPLAIGTETAGSVVTPTNRAALYALKFTVRSLPMDGVFGLSRTFDTLGAMAKSAGDLALLAKVLGTNCEEQHGLDENLAVGFADPAVWNMASEMCAKIPEADEQMSAITTLRNVGHKVEYPVAIPLPSTFVHRGQSMKQYIAFQEFKSAFADFVKEYIPETCSIKCVADMVNWNEEHAEVALPLAHPNQADLISARDNITTDKEVALAITEMRCLGREAGVDAVMEKYGVDLIAAPGDSSLCVLAAAAGPEGTKETPIHYLERQFGYLLAEAAAVIKVNLRYRGDNWLARFAEVENVDYFMVMEQDFSEEVIPWEEDFEVPEHLDDVKLVDVTDQWVKLIFSGLKENKAGGNTEAASLVG